MSKLLVTGRKKLSGEVSVQGAKNSVLPILSATLLARGETVLYNCPDLSDVEDSVNILRYLGCKAERSGQTLVINTDGFNRCDVPDSLMRKTRGSIIFLGAVLAKTGRAKLSLPGGCEIGLRPIDMHLSALKKLGAEIRERRGCIDCRAPYGLSGAKISLNFPSVGATEQVIIAACLAHGTTTLTNAAREPEIADLADFLNSCGAKIYGAGEGEILIEGTGSLSGCAHSIIPDRIAAATFMSAAAATGSEIVLTDVIPAHLGAVISAFEDMGCKIKTDGTKLKITAPASLKPLKAVSTMPYPGFPTDAQAPLMAAACVADGTSVFTENIFENRFRHTRELARMGAEIKTCGRVCVVYGRDLLYGAKVDSTDLRGAAALVVAALCAEGKTRIGSLRYLERGYENLELSLSSLGADIKKI